MCNFEMNRFRVELGSSAIYVSNPTNFHFNMDQTRVFFCTIYRHNQVILQHQICSFLEGPTSISRMSDNYSAKIAEEPQPGIASDLGCP